MTGDPPALGDAARARLAQVPASADSALLDTVALIAKQLRERENELVVGLTGMMAREIDQLDTDPKLVELLEASVHGNISTIIHVLANDIPLDHIQPATAAVEYALRLAQRDVPSNSLVRAYHLGQNQVMLLCYGLIEELGLPAAEAMAVTRHISDVMFAYIDWITLYVFQAYENERGRWISAEANVASSTIHRLLDSNDPDARAFEAETGYRLDQQHLAVIVWTTDTRELSVLDRATRDLARTLRADGPPIITAIDRSTVYAWIPLGSRTGTTDPAELTPPPDIHVAMGFPGSGVAGFRRSHEQAKAAYSVATIPGATATPVVGFGDRGIGVVSLLARDVDATRTWVREVLGNLADDTPATAVLRQTLSVYFATKESHLHTAERLNLHRNTVKYRVGKALAEIPESRDRLDLALALTVCELLGPAVVGP
ncbi:helix-turn-helix domain-containing protein [Gordonia sp. CPCC 205515]|uniref:PucR family transcriptional regulator n=1 Tax=Gordonia sp. CPCC 205515 TaxID=3140791 RepID=UPI003AF370F8